MDMQLSYIIYKNKYIVDIKTRITEFPEIHKQ
jgi:hypothetical protein